MFALDLRTVCHTAARASFITRGTMSLRFGLDPTLHSDACRQASEPSRREARVEERSFSGPCRAVELELELELYGGGTDAQGRSWRGRVSVVGLTAGTLRRFGACVGRFQGAGLLRVSPGAGRVVWLFGWFGLGD